MSDCAIQCFKICVQRLHRNEVNCDSTAMREILRNVYNPGRKFGHQKALTSGADSPTSAPTTKIQTGLGLPWDIVRHYFIHGWGISTQDLHEHCVLLFWVYKVNASFGIRERRNLDDPIPHRLLEADRPRNSYSDLVRTLV
jgi:hypothetical protein